MRLKLILTACCASLLPLTSGISAPLGITQLVVFGDSLSDTGNAAFATGGVLPGPLTNYAPGEFTDGPATNPSTAGPQGIWVDQLAPKLGIAVPLPGFAVPGGTNFAFGGADTGTNPSLPGIPFLDQQVGAYLTTGTASSAALYGFWGGANDIADMKNPVTAADNIYANILALSQAGGKNFLWFDLPPLGETPKAIAAGSAAMAAGDVATAAFNAEWQTDIYRLLGLGINVIGVDTASIFYRAIADFASGCTVGPADPYCFANVTQPAQGQAVNPNTYLFWDIQHPTTTAQGLIADLAFADIDASPEPASVGLALMGLAGCGLLAIRSRPARP